MVTKYVKHRSTGKIYEILTCSTHGLATLKCLETGQISREQDIHYGGQREIQKNKNYVYVEYPEASESEYYSVF
jgi:hypothetical protein